MVLSSWCRNKGVSTHAVWWDWCQGIYILKVTDRFQISAECVIQHRIRALLDRAAAESVVRNWGTWSTLRLHAMPLATTQQAELTGGSQFVAVSEV